MMLLDLLHSNYLVTISNDSGNFGYCVHTKKQGSYIELISREEGRSHIIYDQEINPDSTGFTVLTTDEGFELWVWLHHIRPITPDILMQFALGVPKELICG